MGGVPAQVNYNGQVLSNDMKEQLRAKVYGVSHGRSVQQDWTGKQQIVSSQDTAAYNDALSNWQNGIKPVAVDPTVALSRAMRLGGVYDAAGLGMGAGGLFGFSQALGLSPIKPLDLGSPTGSAYSVPPLPKLGGKG